MGYTLIKSLSLPGKDSAAFLTGIRYCRLDVDEVMEKTRDRRSPGRCFDWVRRLATLCTVLQLRVRVMVNTVIDSILNSGSIPRSAYPEGAEPTRREQQEDEERLIATVSEVGREQSIDALTTYGAISGQAAAANATTFDASSDGAARSEPEVQQAVADGVVGFYRLRSESDFPSTE